jgi:serine/threonine protein kinase
VHDVGPDYLVLEYIEVTALPCPLDPEEAVPLAINIARAIGAAHAEGIIHRDLKPANILMTRERTIKLLDFGLAKLIGETEESTVTAYGSLVGTAAYMFSEQVEGKPLDQRFDIVSFGAVLYEMLTGRRPFAGTTTAQVLAAVMHKQPAPLHRISRPLPNSFPFPLRHRCHGCVANSSSQTEQTRNDFAGEPSFRAFQHSTRFEI